MGDDDEEDEDDKEDGDRVITTTTINFLRAFPKVGGSLEVDMAHV